MRVNFRRPFGAVAAAMVAVLSTQAPAQSPPSGTIRFIVGAAAGGAIDPYARLIAEHMARTLGRTVIVENKPGAAGNISAQFVVDAPADGGLIWVGTQAMTEINPSAFTGLRWSIDDFIPIIKGVESGPVLVTHPSVPARTLAELVTWIKQSPRKHTYASWSPGTPSHFLGFQLNETFKLDMTHVPYRGSAPQTTDLVAGHQLLGFGQMQSTLPHIRAGKLNAIAQTSSTRTRFLPDTPTFAELGYPDFTATVWFGLLTKVGTPPDVVKRYTDAAKAAHADPDVKAKLEAQGFDVSGLSGPEFAAGIRAQIARWRRLVEATGFRAN